MSDLLKAVRSKDEELIHHWSKQEEWATVEELMAANSTCSTLCQSFVTVLFLEVLHTFLHTYTCI